MEAKSIAFQQCYALSPLWFPRTTMGKKMH
jgi:hypothetical protein